MTEANLNDDVEKVLFHEATILARLDELAAEITALYRGRDLTVVAILHGGVIFMADLLRRVHLPLRIETITVASYHGGTESSGEVTFNQTRLPDLRGQDVLLLDDILDTGRTLAAIKRRLAGECGADSVRTCVLLSKRRPRDEDVCADLVGFAIDDEFVVGYGLDYQGRFRNLPFVGTLKASRIALGKPA
jgi:hypoxanthine phosphoribosyltransferase